MTRRKSPLKYIVIGLFLLVVLYLFRLPAVSSSVKNFFYLVSSPIQKTLWRAGAGVSNFFGGIGRLKGLSEENERLKSENQNLTSQLAQLQESVEENKSLREALSIQQETVYELLLVDVISRDISKDELVINKGKKDGVVSGMPVLTDHKALFGKVSEVYDQFSRVTIISSKNSSFDAEIHDDEEVAGVVKGRGNLTLMMDLLPKDKEYKEGDIVVTTSLGGVYPAGILVGRLGKVSKNDVEPSYQAEIRSAFSINETETLFVVTDY